MNPKKWTKALNKVVDITIILTVGLNLITLISSFNIPLLIRFPIVYIPLGMVLVYSAYITLNTIATVTVMIVTRIIKLIVVGLNKILDN